MQLIRVHADYNLGDPTAADLEFEGSADETASWAGLICGGIDAFARYRYGYDADPSSPELSEAGYTELRLCMARAYFRMAETARAPIVIKTTGATITIPVQSGAARITLYARAVEYARYAWDMADDDLYEYLTTGSMTSGEDTQPQQSGQDGAVLLTDAEATTQAKLLGPIMREAFDRFQEYHLALIQQIVAVADAELASTTSTALSSFRGVSRDELSRSWAAHLLVGGDPGLTGIRGGTTCGTPKLSPQAERAVEIFRRAAPSPADILSDLSITELLDSNSQSVESVRRRLIAFFDENIPNSVEERFQLQTQDFIEARQYLQDELRVFARSPDRKLAAIGNSSMRRYAALAHPPVTLAPYWAAVARGKDSGGGGIEVLATKLRNFQLQAQFLISQKDGTAEENQDAIFGPLASILSDLGEQIPGELAWGTAGDNQWNAFASLTDWAKNSLTGLRVAVGEDGLSCATRGTIEGDACSSTELTTLSRTLTLLPHTEGTDWTYKSASFDGGEDASVRAYLVYSYDGSSAPGHFRVLGGSALYEGGFTLAPHIDERAASLLEPNEKWCTQPKVGCQEADNHFTFDARLPLENELADDGDAIESSWKYYLNKAKEAATNADSLGEAYILANLDSDNRKETVEMRIEARRAEAEQALSALQTTCGTDVDPVALLNLLANGDVNKTTDLSNLREKVSCTTNADCVDPAHGGAAGFVCVANSCIIDIPKYLDTRSQSLDAKLTEGLHRLAECIDEDTETPIISLGNQPLCAYYLDAQSQLCQTANGDKFAACPALSTGTNHCDVCRSPTQQNCYQVPQGANNARYHAIEIKDQNLLNFFETSKAQINLSPRNACNFISDALRWDPAALVLDLPGTATQTTITPKLVDFWAERIKSSGMFHPAGDIKKLIERIGFQTNFQDDKNGAITLDGQSLYTVSTPGNLWWYKSDASALAAILALKLSYPDLVPSGGMDNVSFPYYTAHGSDTIIETTQKFLFGGQLYSRYPALGFANSTERRRYADGGEAVCDKRDYPLQAVACTIEHGFPENWFTSIRTEGLSPEVYAGYGSLTGESLIDTGQVHTRLAVGTWPRSLKLEGPPTSWWWNGFSTAKPESDTGGKKCREGDCSDLLRTALLQDRTLGLAQPFRPDPYRFGDLTMVVPVTMASLSLTTADLLRGAQLACEVVDFDNSFRCDPSNPPTVNSVNDLANVKKAMDCSANMIEGRAGEMLFAHFPIRARNALRQQGVVGAFPQVGGEVGKKTSDISSTLLAIKQAVVDVGVEARLIGLALDQLRTDQTLKDVRDQIVDINFRASVANLVTSCLKETAQAIGVTTAVQPGNALAAAIGCANSVVQIDLAGKLSGAQAAENQLVFLTSLNGIRETLATRSANMQRLKSELLQNVSTLDGQLSELETLRSDARRQLSRALYTASSQAQSEPTLTNVYANRASGAQVRYRQAHQRAVKLAYLARRAIEMRLGVDLSTLTEDYPLVQAPATWATTLCSSTGVDYDKLRKDSKEFAATFQTNFADAYIGAYVQKLEDFVEAYRLRHAFQEGNDTIVASLRDDILGVKATCETESRNELRGTHHLAARWGASGCASESDCIRALDLTGTVANGALGQPAVDSVVYQPSDPDLKLANPISVYLGAEDGSACTAPACGYAIGAGLVQKVFPREKLYPQSYILSWYYPTGDAEGPNLVEVLDDALHALPGVTSGTAPTSRVTGWTRSFLKFKLEAAQTLAIRLGGKLDATAHGKHFYLAAPMLEPVSGQNPLPNAFENSDDEGKHLDLMCPDVHGETFRLQSWHRECVRLCADGYASSCANQISSDACFREVSFSLSQRDIELGKVLSAAGFAQANYNYRIQDIGINLVGTALSDCSASDAPQSCYGSGNFQFSLVHSGPFIVRNHMGEDYEAQLFDGHIEHGRALASERYITNPMSSTDRDLLGTFLRHEFAGRPLAGRYALRVWETPSLDFNAIEDVQIVMNYRYWTRSQ